MVRHADASLSTLIDAMLDDCVEMALREPKEWAALLMIERQVKDLQGFQDFHVGLQQTWVDAFESHGPAVPLTEIKNHVGHGPRHHVWLVHTRNSGFSG
jgi:hypothetical protein